MTAGSLAWYAVNSLFAPRAAARQLMGETDVLGISWKLIALGAAAIFLSSLAINSAFIGDRTDLLSDSSFLFFDGYAGIAFEALLSAISAILFTLIGVLIWKYVFRYKDPRIGALAAGALGLVINVLISPVLDVLFGFSNTWSFAAQMWVFAATLLPLVLLPSYYYSEIFNIGVLHAFLLNVGALLLFIVPVLLMTISIVVAYWGLDAFISGAVT
jgi:low affinity Fe/Cu permease